MVLISPGCEDEMRWGDTSRALCSALIPQCLIVMGGMPTSALGSQTGLTVAVATVLKLKSWEVCGFHRGQENVPVGSSFVKVRA